MALRPYDQQMQLQQQQQQMQMQQQQMMDPFNQMDAMMDQMMMSPFGGMASRRRGGPGGIFGMMDAMMGGMGGMGGMRGMGDMEAMGGGGMMSSCMMMSSGGGEGGFSSQTMMMSSSLGADGKRHTERYSSSTVGDRARQVAETQQAYSNSNTGVDKMSLEQQMAERSRKMVKEYNRQSGDERSTDMFKGMTEDQTGQFDADWRQNAQPHLPQHVSMRQLMAPQAQGQQTLYASAPSSTRQVQTPTVTAGAASSGYPVSMSRPGTAPQQYAQYIPAGQAQRSQPATYTPGQVRQTQPRYQQ